MPIKLEHTIRRACHFLLDHSIDLYPLDRQPWGRAAAAEVRVMPSLLTAMGWTLGGLYMAIKAFVVRLFAQPANLVLGRHSLLRSNWRSLSPLFLALSLTLFLVPQFREALRTTTSMWMAGDGYPGISARRLDSLQRTAERNHDARTLAFLALRTTDIKKSTHLAEEAVALDGSLTWIFAEIPTWDEESFREHAQWFGRLERWDPDNAVPLLMHADTLVYSAQLSLHQDQQTILAQMRQSEFRRLMDRALAAPRYDSYLQRRFELDREVMWKHDLAEPLLLLEGLQYHRIPSLMNSQTYARWPMEEAKSLAAGGDLPAAAEKYRLIFNFGQRMETQAQTALERMFGNHMQQQAGTELLPILRRQGKTDEAATLEYLLRQAMQAQDREVLLQAALLEPRMMPLDRANPLNPGIIIHVAALLFLIMFSLVTAGFFYLRVRRAKSVNAVPPPRLISYAPALLFTAALILLVTYLPYARIFRMYMSDARVFHLRLNPGVARIHDPGHSLDFGLLSSLSNLQYPFAFVAGREIHWIVAGAFAVVLGFGLFALSRMRVNAASA